MLTEAETGSAGPEISLPSSLPPGTPLGRTEVGANAECGQGRWRCGRCSFQFRQFCSVLSRFDGAKMNRVVCRAEPKSVFTPMYCGVTGWGRAGHGRTGKVLGHFFLGHSWNVPGMFLERAWDAPGAFLERSWNVLGRAGWGSAGLGRTGRVLGHLFLWHSWNVLGMFLGRSWNVPGTFLV